MTYVAFAPPHLLSEYLGRPGHEIGGQALSPYALEALAQSKTTRIPCELAVIGRHDYEDGRFYLDFAVTRAYVESVSEFRWDDGRLRLVCPSCGWKDGKHTRGCDR